MNTTLVSPRKSEPDDGCTLYTKSTSRSRWVSLVLLLFILGLSNLPSWAQAPDVTDGNPNTWPAILNNIANIKKAFTHDTEIVGGQFDGTEDQFTGGSKDTGANPSTDWTWKFGEVNDKGNIQNAGALMLVNPDNGHNILYFFGDRTADEGSAQIGFWFFLDDVHPTGTGVTGSPFTGEHRNGDILLISNFTNGGGTAAPFVYIWAGKTATSPGGLVPAGAGVVTAISTNTVQRDVPNATMFNGQSWIFAPKNNQLDKYEPPLFFEGLVDINTICPVGVCEVNPCFQSFLMETRNSHALNASLQDFAGGRFSGVPDAPVAGPNSICLSSGASGSVALTASGCSGTLTWYAAASGGSALGTGSPFNTPAISQTTSFYVSCTVDGCEGPRTEVVATVNPNPVVQNATDTFCAEDQSNTLLSDYDDNVGPGAGYTVAWFSDAARTIPITQTGDLAVGAHTFYAKVTNNTTQCDANAQVVITINPTPAVQNATDTFCAEDQSNTLLSDYDDNVGPGAGYTVAWFSDAARTIPITQTGDLAVGAHTFYAKVTNNTTLCDANAQVVITINPTPVVQNASDTFCAEDQSNTLLSDYDDNVGPGAGYTVAWFSDAARTIPITQTGDLAVGAHTFYAKVTNNTTLCDANAQVVITINPTPVVQNASDTFCAEDQSNTLLSDYDDNVGPGAGYTVAWFSDAARTIPITQTGDLAVGAHTFYAKVTNNITSCDANAQVVITINPTPVVQNASDTFCAEDQSNTLLSDYDDNVGPGAGYTVAWFSDAARTIPITQTGDLAVGSHTFYAKVTNNITGCDANAQVVININATPIVQNASDTFCAEDQSNTILSDYDDNVGPGAGFTVAWFSDAARTIPITQTGDLAVGNHTFYATVTSNSGSCNADAQLVITINATPVVQNASDTFCAEDQSNTLLSDYDDNVGPGAGYTVAWFSDAARTIPITQTGDLAVGAHTFYAKVTNNTTLCDANAQVVITINPTPVVQNASDTFCAEDQSNTLLSDYDDNVGPGAGYTVAWFSDAARTIPITQTGDLAVGAHTFYAKVTNNVTGCDANAQVVININPTPVVQNASDAFCEDLQSNSILSDYDDNVGPGAGYTVSWFSDAARTIPITETGDLAVGSHTFYAKVTNNATGCDANAELVITIHPLPVIKCPDPDSYTLQCGISLIERQNLLQAAFDAWLAKFDPQDPKPTIKYTYIDLGVEKELVFADQYKPEIVDPSITRNYTATATFVVTSEYNCVSRCTSTFAVNNPCSPGCEITNVSDATCFGLSDGSISVSASGGTTPYTINLYNDPIVDINSPLDSKLNVGELEVVTFSGLAAGKYLTVAFDNVTAVGDATPCSAEIKEPSDLVLTDVGDVTVDCGATATVSGSFSGGEAPYIVYLDSDDPLLGQSATILEGQPLVFSFSGVSVGSHTIIVISKNGAIGVDNGCQDSDGFQVFENTCGEGCTPGYWQGGKDVTNGASGKALWITSTQAIPMRIKSLTGRDFYQSVKFNDFFGTTSGVGCAPDNNLTLFAALDSNFKGKKKGCEMLFRAGVAAILNAATLDQYPLPDGVVTLDDLRLKIKDAIDKCDCASLTAILSANNELPHNRCGQITFNDFSKEVQASLNSSSSDMIIAYPNPFKDHVTFELKTDVAGDATVQIFNILGQKMFDVFNDHMDAGTSRTVEFHAPYTLNEGMLIYVYKIGDRVFTGRLIIKQ